MVSDRDRHDRVRSHLCLSVVAQSGTQFFSLPLSILRALLRGLLRPMASPAKSSVAVAVAAVNGARGGGKGSGGRGGRDRGGRGGGDEVEVVSPVAMSVTTAEWMAQLTGEELDHRNT